ncbi:MAG: hypothetical protein Q4D20_08875, partial [Clostridia bacterium]|nr:hypothetical protein [Clostridia bacterium]
MKNTFKKTLSVFLAAVLAVLSCSCISFAAWDGSTKTEPALKDGVYQIATENELAWFAEEVNGSNNAISAVLTDDIDLGETKWIQIGNASNDFNGTFDGNGKKVTYSITKHTAIYAGLFRGIGKNGVVKNLTTDGVVTVNTARNYHGGVAGFNNGTISNCTNYVSLATSSTKRVTYVGGIVGKNTGVIENCVNNGTVNVTSYAGGSVKNCVNNGEVSSTNVAGCSGGIIAAVTANASDNKMSVANCINNGKVTGGSGDYGYAGGIIAQENVASSYNTYGGQPELKIEGCVNKGELSGGNTENILAKQGKNCTIEIVEKSEPSEEDVKYVADAAKALDDSWFKLCPIYGKDTNVNDIVKEKLASLGYGEANVSIKSSEDESCIAPDGSITYFYADPESERYLWFNSVPVVFIIEKGGATAEYSVNAVVHWDRAKVENYLSENIISKVTYEAILGENESADEVTKNLNIPKVVDNKKFTLISWVSSDPDSIKIDSSKQNTADTLFEPYIGVVKPGAEDKEVTLTATFTFNRTASYGEEEITMTKDFKFTVKALSFETKKEMQKLLDENYTIDKLKIFGSKTSIDPENVASDIQLVIPAETGIKDYDSYKFSVSSSDSSVIKINSYRAFVFQPLSGEDSKTVDLTVTMSSKEYNVSVSKTFTVTVVPLTQDEIDREIALMDLAVEHYFDGINNGANA